jgi:hypothetical protein
MRITQQAREAHTTKTHTQALDVPILLHVCTPARVRSLKSRGDPTTKNTFDE